MILSRHGIFGGVFPHGRGWVVSTGTRIVQTLFSEPLDFLNVDLLSDLARDSEGVALGRKPLHVHGRQLLGVLL